MTSLSQRVVSCARISDVWQALGGDPPRRGRARAFWRGGDSYSVSLSDAKGTWYDFRDSIGGGILDLVQHVRGDGRREALKWLADFGCIPFDRPLTEAERREYRRRKVQAESEARALVTWRDGLIATLRGARNVYFEAYHRARLYIRDHGLDAPLGELAADVYEIAEVRYQALDEQLDLFRDANFAVLLPYFRAHDRRAA